MKNMSRQYLLRGLSLLFCGSILTAGAVVYSAEPKPPTQHAFDDYKVIWEQNMFVKDRRRPYSSTTRRSGGDVSRDGRGIRTAESLYALRGVVLEDGQFLRAYFEDMTDGKMLRLNVGDPIAKGHIAEIAIDAVAYEANGQVTWVNVGTDLRGQVAMLASSSDSPRIATSAPTTTASGTGDAGTASGGTGAAAVDPSTLSIEERMRQRRLQGK